MNKSILYRHRCVLLWSLFVFYMLYICRFEGQCIITSILFKCGHTDESYRNNFMALVSDESVDLLKDLLPTILGMMSLIHRGNVIKLVCEMCNTDFDHKVESELKVNEELVVEAEHSENLRLLYKLFNICVTGSSSSTLCCEIYF